MTLPKGDDGFWFISLSETKIYWFDLVVEPLEHESINTRDAIASDLKAKEIIDRKSKASRFVYFFASRPRVRIDTSIPLEFDLKSRVLTFRVLLGRESKPIWLKPKMEIDEGIIESVYLTSTDRSIRIYSNSETSRTVSIHDFLAHTNLSLGKSTEILYVGSTADQASRFLKRQHRGVTDSIYQKGSESHDFFFYSNVFTVHESLNYHSASARLISQVVSLNFQDCKEECEVVENGLIRYFGCKSQKLNEKPEVGKLRNAFINLHEKRGISKLAYHIEVEPEPNYFNFFSVNAKPKSNHTFMYTLKENEVDLSVFANESKMAKAL